MGFLTRTKPATAGDHTGEEIARRLKPASWRRSMPTAGEAFQQAVSVMLRTGQPITVPSAAALNEWCGPLDELPDDEVWAVDVEDVSDG